MQALHIQLHKLVIPFMVILPFLGVLIAVFIASAQAAASNGMQKLFITYFCVFACMAFPIM